MQGQLHFFPFKVGVCVIIFGIPYFLTLVGLVTYLFALSSSLGLALITGMLCAYRAQKYSEKRARKKRQQLNKTY